MPFSVSCGACGASFKLSQEIYERRIKGRQVALRCKKCRAEIPVDGTKFDDDDATVVVANPELAALVQSIADPNVSFVPQPPATETAINERAPMASAPEILPRDTSWFPSGTSESVAPAIAEAQNVPQATVAPVFSDPPSEAPSRPPMDTPRVPIAVGNEAMPTPRKLDANALRAAADPAPFDGPEPASKPGTAAAAEALASVADAHTPRAAEASAPAPEASKTPESPRATMPSAAEARAPAPRVAPRPKLDSKTEQAPKQEVKKPELVSRPKQDFKKPELVSRPKQEAPKPEVRSRPKQEVPKPELQPRPKHGAAPKPELVSRPKHGAPPKPEMPSRPKQEAPKPELVSRPKHEAPPKPELPSRPKPEAPTAELPSRPKQESRPDIERQPQPAPRPKQESRPDSAAQPPPRPKLESRPNLAAEPPARPRQQSRPRFESEPRLAPSAEEEARARAVAVSAVAKALASTESNAAPGTPASQPTHAPAAQNSAAAAVAAVPLPRPISLPPARPSLPPARRRAFIAGLAAALVISLVGLGWLLSTVSSKSDLAVPSGSASVVSAPPSQPTAKADEEEEEEEEAVGPAPTAPPTGESGPVPTGSAPGLLEQAVANLNSQTGDDRKSFDREAALKALDAAANRASRCRSKGDPSGNVTVLVIFNPSGTVKEAKVVDTRYDGRPTARCIASRMAQARIRPFEGTPKTLAKSVLIP